MNVVNTCTQANKEELKTSLIGGRFKLVIVKKSQKKLLLTCKIKASVLRSHVNDIDFSFLMGPSNILPPVHALSLANFQLHSLIRTGHPFSNWINYFICSELD